MSCGHVVHQPWCEWCVAADVERHRRRTDEERLRLERKRLGVARESLRLQRDAALRDELHAAEERTGRARAEEGERRDAAAADEAQRADQVRQRFSTLRQPSGGERCGAAVAAGLVTVVAVSLSLVDRGNVQLLVGVSLVALGGWLYLKYRRGGWWLVRRFGAIDVTLLGCAFGSSAVRPGGTGFAGNAAPVTPGQVIGALFVILIAIGLSALLVKVPATRA